MAHIRGGSADTGVWLKTPEFDHIWIFFNLKPCRFRAVGIKRVPLVVLVALHYDKLLLCKSLF